MSDSLPLMNESYHKPTSRMSLVQSALRAFLINVGHHHSEHRVRLFLFNHVTEMVQGTLDELQSRMDHIIADNGTNMILCLQHMKKAYDACSLHDQERIICGILTDGMHNTSHEKDLTIDQVVSDSFYNTFFRSIIGIGHRDTVDYALLTKLTGGRKDVFQLVAEERDVFHAMNGTFFDLLTSHVTDATFSIWCHHDDQLVNMANVQTIYHTEDEYQAVHDPMVPGNTFMRLVHHDGTYVLEYTEPPKEDIAHHSVTPREFWLAIDVSGSMESAVMGSKPEPTTMNQIVPPVSTHPYVEVRMAVSSVNEHTHLLGRGSVVASYVTYTHPRTKTVTTESIVCLELHDTTPIMELVTTLVNVSNRLGQVMTKKHVQEVYHSHLYLSKCSTEESIPPWLQAQVKVVWNNLKQRYRSTLTYGEQFFHQTPVAYDTMLRATSSEASTQSATPFFSNSMTDIPMDEINKCKLCYENTITVLFPECRHAGLCKECYTMYRTTTGKQDCPFCRVSVTSWSLVSDSHLKNGYCQELGCYHHCDYIGHAINEIGAELCGHLLYCKGCTVINKKKEEGLVCQECQNVVQEVRIYLC